MAEFGENIEKKKLYRNVIFLKKGRINIIKQTTNFNERFTKYKNILIQRFSLFYYNIGEFRFFFSIFYFDFLRKKRIFSQKSIFEGSSNFHKLLQKSKSEIL